MKFNHNEMGSDLPKLIMDDDGDGDVDDGDGVDVDDGDVVELTQSCFELRAAHTLGLTSPLGSQTAPAGNFRTRLRAPGKPTPEFQNVSHKSLCYTEILSKCFTQSKSQNHPFQGHIFSAYICWTFKNDWWDENTIFFYEDTIFSLNPHSWGRSINKKVDETPKM